MQVRMLQFVNDMCVQRRRVGKALDRQRMLRYAWQAEIVGHRTESQHKMIERQPKITACLAVRGDDKTAFHINALNLRLTHNCSLEQRSQRKDDVLRLNGSRWYFRQQRRKREEILRINQCDLHHAVAAEHPLEPR